MSTLRKRRLSQPTEPDDDSAPLSLASVATIDYSSEDPAHPGEHLVDEHTGPGGSYWAAAQADTTEQLVLEFDRPQSIGRLVYEVQEMERERTQEVHVEASTDAAEAMTEFSSRNTRSVQAVRHSSMKICAWSSTTSRTCGSPSSPTSAGRARLPSPHFACSPDPPHQASVPAL